MKSPVNYQLTSLVFVGMALVWSSTGVTAPPRVNRDYLNPRLPVEQRVAHLLGQMSLEEKVGQMCMANLRSANLEQLVQEGQVGALVGFNRPASEVNRWQRSAVEGSRLRIPLRVGLDVVHGYATTFPIPRHKRAVGIRLWSKPFPGPSAIYSEWFTRLFPSP